MENQTVNLQVSLNDLIVNSVAETLVVIVK